MYLGSYFILQLEGDIMKKLLSFMIIVYLSIFLTKPVVAAFFQGIEYTVINKSTLKNRKCTLNIRLEKKVQKELLENFAVFLKNAEKNQYEIMFINYYLPGMALGSGAWATSHFNPTLQVNIWGATTEEENMLIGNTKRDSHQIIGKWFDDLMGAKYTLLKRNGKIIMTYEFKDGSSLEKVMDQTREAGKLRFEAQAGTRFGEYFIIERNGDLGAYDKVGFIRKMRPIK